MSKLQKMLQKITQVIVSYYETQTSHSYPLESYWDKSPEDLQKFLHSLIVEATKKWPTRRSLLNYFLFVVDTIKPIIDKKTPLTDNEQQLILNTLVLLLTTSRHLLSSYQSETVNVKYGEITIPMPGFVRGLSKGYSYCNTGQVINRILFEPLDITKDTDITEMIKQLIASHQVPLLETEKLVREIDSKNTRIISLQTENNHLLNQLAILRSQYETELQAKTMLFQEKRTAVEESEQLQIELKKERTHRDTLSEERTIQKTQCNLLQEKNAELTSQLAIRNSDYEVAQQQNILMLKEKETLVQECEYLKSALKTEKTKMERLQEENKSLLEQQSMIKNQLITALQKNEEHITEISQMHEQNNKINGTAFVPSLFPGSSFGNFGLKGNFFAPRPYPLNPATIKTEVIEEDSNDFSSSGLD